MDDSNNTQQNQDPQNQTPPVSEQPVAISQQPTSQGKKSKKMALLLSLVALFVVVFSSAAYGYFVYIPNKPENVLKKAVENLSEDVVSAENEYKLSLITEQSDLASPGVNLTVEVDSDKDIKIGASVEYLSLSPNVDIIISNNKAYVRVNNLINSNGSLASVSALSGVDVDNVLKSSGLADLQGKWIELPSDIYDETFSDYKVKPEEVSLNLDSFNAQMLSYEGSEEIDGRTTNKYKVLMSVEDIAKVLTGILGVSESQELLKSADIDKNLRFEFDVWVDKSSKGFKKLQYSGNMQGVSIQLTLELSDVDVAAPENPTKIDDLQKRIEDALAPPRSAADLERIADLAGMKAAFEQYYDKNGSYPDRYSIAVQQEQFLNANLPGVNHQFFIDPNGKRAGLNGSQYAYVPEQSSSSDACGANNYGPCGKYFLATTLDSGEHYQVNSDHGN